MKRYFRSTVPRSGPKKVREGSADGLLATAVRAVELFERRERWRLLAMFAAIVLMALVETIGVASIMPFMALVATPDAVEKYAFLQRLYELVGFRDRTQFLIFVGVLSLVAMVVGNGCSALTTWMIAKMSWNQNYVLSTRLLEKYLARPYSYYLTHNTASLANSVLGEVASVTTGVVQPFMQMIARGIVVLCIISLLVVVNGPVALYVSAGLAGAYGLIYLYLRDKQRKLGQDRLASARLRFKAAAEALTGVKDIKVLGREKQMVNRFRAPSYQYSAIMAKGAIVGTFPRFAMETIAYGGVLLLVIFMLAGKQDVVTILPAVSLYALAGYRIMPGLQQVLKSLVTIRFNLGPLETLHEALVRYGSELGDQLSETEGSGVLKFDDNITLTGVTFAYAGSHRPALSGVTLTIPHRSQVGLVGATGAGKSTLVDILLGLLDPEQGAIAVDGVPIERGNVRAWRRAVGYVPQNIFLSDETIEHNIALGIPHDQVDQKSIDRAARVANIHDFVMSLPSGYDTIVGERGVRLSGGQRQRIGIARALYHDPEVIVFDEATSSLDGVTEAAVLDAVGRLARTKTLIMIAHRLTTVRSCDKIYVLDQGAITDAGSYDELMVSSSKFRAMSGVK